VLLGLVMALIVAVLTYFNDQIIRQTSLIGNYLPIGVFGVMLVVLLLLNPLLSALSRGMGFRTHLRGSEIAVATAIGLAACGWPASGFYRHATTLVTLPQHQLQSQTSWQANHVMSYVPEGSPALAEGHVLEFESLAEQLLTAEDGAARFVREQLAEGVMQQLEAWRQARSEQEASTPLSWNLRSELLFSLNRRVLEVTNPPLLYERAEVRDALERRSASVLQRLASVREQLAALSGSTAADDSPAPSAGTGQSADQTRRRSLEVEAAWLKHRLNRAALVSLWPDLLLPMPRGQTLLVSHGRNDPAVIPPMLQGSDEQFNLDAVPWERWSPIIRYWGVLALLFGFIGLAMAVIVHPQWSKRELLTYPIARFTAEATRREPGDWLPTIARNRMFWYGLGGVVLLHLINGMHEWYPTIPQIPLQFDLNPARQLFPNASRVWGSWGYFAPRLILSVAAFAFFLNSSVSFSLGFAHVFYLFLGAILLANGEQFNSDWLGYEKPNMMRFGAYVGITAMILYTGRRYYLNVLTSAVGGPRGTETPGYAVWAGRALLVLTPLKVWWLMQTGLAWPFAVLLVLSRIVAETGAFFLQTAWTPVGVLAGLMGFEAIGPTGYVIMAFASLMLVGDPRELVMPFVTNALRIGEQAGEAHPPRTIPWLAVALVLTFVVAGVVTLGYQYGRGVNHEDSWATKSMPSFAFQRLSLEVSEVSSRGQLAEITAPEGVSRLALFSPDGEATVWMLVGLALVIATAAARLRLSWWPIHPVAFLVWGTYPIVVMGPSFLVGWMIKTVVVRLMGAKGYQRVLPLMVGIIAGELLAILLLLGIGGTYYLATGRPPEMEYKILPN
jgi:hypothetical protein